MKAGVKMVWMLSVPIFLLYFFGSEILLRLFLDEPTQTAIQTGVTFMRIVAPFYFVISLKMGADGVMRGAGYMKQFMTATFTDLLLRVGLAILLSGTVLGATGIWCAWPIGWCVGTVLSLWFYRKGPWYRVEEKRE